MECISYQISRKVVSFCPILKQWCRVIVVTSTAVTAKWKLSISSPEVQLYSSLTSAVMEVSGRLHSSAASHPIGRTCTDSTGSSWVEQLIISREVKYSPRFVEPTCSLQCPQKPVNAPSSEWLSTFSHALYFPLCCSPRSWKSYLPGLTAYIISCI